MDNTITVSTTVIPSAFELKHLFNQTDWANNRTLDDIEKLIKFLGPFVTITEDNKLIGFGRIITDGIYRALLDDIIIDSNYRGQGLGNTIVEELLNLVPHVEEVYVNTSNELESFYNKFNFNASQSLTMKLNK